MEEMNVNMDQASQSTKRDELKYSIESVPPMGVSILLALQHILAAFAGIIAVPLVVCAALKLSVEQTTLMVGATIFASGITTILQSKGLGPIGSRVSGMMGTDFTFVNPSISVGAKFGIAGIITATITGSFVEIILSRFIKPLMKFFPPLITGTVVFAIGLSLYPTAINYMAGGTSNEHYGAWQNWLVAIIVLCIVTYLNHYGKGIFKLASILIGIIIGYIISIFFGMVDFSSVTGASLISIPQPLHFGIKFDPSACVAIGLLFAINAIQAIGDFSATTTGGLDRMPTDEELKGGIVAYGISNVVGAVFGGLPTATYSQNVGIVASTKVVARKVFRIAAVILLVAGLVPVFSAVLTTIPYCVLGGATISVFASITMTGIKLITTQPLDFRNTTIVGLAIALGMGVTQANAALATFPAWVTTIFGKSPVVLAMVTAVVLNLLLPKPKGSAVEPAEEKAE